MALVEGEREEAALVGVAHRAVEGGAGGGAALVARAVWMYVYVYGWMDGWMRGWMESGGWREWTDSGLSVASE